MESSSPDCFQGFEQTFENVDICLPRMFQIQEIWETFISTLKRQYTAHHTSVCLLWWAVGRRWPVAEQGQDASKSLPFCDVWQWQAASWWHNNLKSLSVTDHSWAVLIRADQATPRSISWHRWAAHQYRTDIYINTHLRIHCHVLFKSSPTWMLSCYQTPDISK